MGAVRSWPPEHLCFKEALECWKDVYKRQALFSRAQEVSQDAYLCSEARNMEAYCLLCLDRPQEALSRLGEDCRRASPSEAIQAMAYSRLGQTEKRCV